MVATVEVLTAVLAKAGVSWEQVADRRALTGGTFNDVQLVRLADGTELVVKLPPGPAVRLLRYEHGLAGTEALYYRLAGRCEGVTVPAVIFVDDTGLVMTYCPGTPWPELTPRPAGAERDELRAELGRQVASLHTITGPGFGYPSLALGPLRENWRDAFLGMVDAVLADAGTYAVTLPRPATDIRALFAGQAAVLDEVTTPVLVHFDLWDGNILIDGDRVGALIDAERAFWGDPVAEFGSLALFGDIEQDAAFLHGYRAAGGTVTFDAATRRRLDLYQAYLYLIMWVEAVPRQVSEKRKEWLRGTVLQPLTSTFTAWSSGGSAVLWDLVAGRWPLVAGPLAACPGGWPGRSAVGRPGWRLHRGQIGANCRLGWMAASMRAPESGNPDRHARIAAIDRSSRAGRRCIRGGSD
jgi:aminoglycoside phosphotransferase (APT) family kinase protein